MNAATDFHHGAAGAFPGFIHAFDFVEHRQAAFDCGAVLPPVAAINGCAENNHQAVADVFVDVAAVALNDLIHPSKIIVQPFDDFVRRVRTRRAS